MYRSPTLVDNLTHSLWKLANNQFTGIIHVAGQRMAMPNFFKYLTKIAGLKNPKINLQPINDSQHIAKDTSLNTKFVKNLKIL